MNDRRRTLLPNKRSHPIISETLKKFYIIYEIRLKNQFSTEIHKLQQCKYKKQQINSIR